MENNGVAAAPPQLSLWAAVHSWFTPTVLFVLLNLVIGTIAVTSKASSKSRDDNEEEIDGNVNANNGNNNENGEPFKSIARAPSLARSPSIVLDRLRSFTLHRATTPPPPQQQTQPPPMEINHHHHQEEEEEEEEEDHQQLLDRSRSDAKPTAGELPEKLAGKMKKSASEMLAFNHFKEADVAAAMEVMPVPVKAVAAEEVVEEEGGGGGEVDARADAFINRFKQQLKLQRLDSIIRYKDMLGRGT